MDVGKRKEIVCFYMKCWVFCIPSLSSFHKARRLISCSCCVVLLLFPTYPQLFLFFPLPYSKWIVCNYGVHVGVFFLSFFLLSFAS